nr:hypothetical protein [uncultured Acidocella sp.]
MADYFIHFSCLFDVGTPDNAKRALELYHNSEPNDDDRCLSDGFEMSLPEEGGTKLWMHDDVSGDPELLIEFVLRCAEEFDLKGLWGFTYADTCRRPRLDAFGGGAHVIDLGARKTLGWISTDEWLCDSLTGEAPDA